MREGDFIITYDESVSSLHRFYPKMGHPQNPMVWKLSLHPKPRVFRAIRWF